MDFHKTETIISDRETILIAQCCDLTERLEAALMTDPISAQLSENDWWEAALKVRDERIQRDLTSQIAALQKTAKQLAQYNDHLLAEKQRLEREVSSLTRTLEPRAFSTLRLCTAV